MKARSCWGIVISLIVMSFFSSLLLGHGIKVTLEKRYPCVIANARYHGSKALIDANVTISFVPGTPGTTGDIVFQKGSTDKNGNFCFSPDKPGTWTVMVDDLTGHRGKKTITLSEDFFTIASPPGQEVTEAIPVKEELPSQEEKQPAKSIPTSTRESKEKPVVSTDLCCYLLKILLGTLLILAVTYTWYRFKKKQETSENRKS